MNIQETKLSFELARMSIETSLKHQKLADIGEQILEKLGHQTELLLPRGCFVTLKKKNGHLRGCIGCIQSDEPLYRNIMHNAYLAAFKDPRFPPLTEEEYQSITLEISVMGPIQNISSFDEIVVGQHGLIATRGHQRGLLLPQVPIEWKWSKEEFISHTCQKAGLAPDAYKKEGVSFQIFTANILQEEA